MAARESILHFNGLGWETVFVGSGADHIGGSSTDVFALGTGSERIRIVQ